MTRSGILSKRITDLNETINEKENSKPTVFIQLINPNSSIRKNIKQAQEQAKKGFSRYSSFNTHSF